MLLSDFKAENIRINTREPEKFRIYCNLSDKQDAKEFYSKFTQSLPEPMKAVIFIDLAEEVFVKHGDIEAEKFYKE